MRAQKLPVHSRAAALVYLQQHPRAGLYILQLAHDDGCPAIVSQCDAMCRPPCCPDVYLVDMNNPAKRGRPC